MINEYDVQKMQQQINKKQEMLDKVNKQLEFERIRQQLLKQLQQEQLSKSQIESSSEQTISVLQQEMQKIRTYMAEYNSTNYIEMKKIQIQNTQLYNMNQTICNINYGYKYQNMKNDHQIYNIFSSIKQNQINFQQTNKKNNIVNLENKLQQERKVIRNQLLLERQQLKQQQKYKKQRNFNRKEQYTKYDCIGNNGKAMIQNMKNKQRLNKLFQSNDKNYNKMHNKLKFIY